MFFFFFISLDNKTKKKCIIPFKKQKIWLFENQLNLNIARNMQLFGLNDIMFFKTKGEKRPEANKKQNSVSFEILSGLISLKIQSEMVLFYLGCLWGAGDMNCAGLHPVCLRPLIKCEAAFASASVSIGQRAIVPARKHTHTDKRKHTKQQSVHCLSSWIMPWNNRHSGKCLRLFRALPDVSTNCCLKFSCMHFHKSTAWHYKQQSPPNIRAGWLRM